MHLIKNRGYCLDIKRWVYGYYFSRSYSTGPTIKTKHYIIENEGGDFGLSNEMTWEVVDESVGQFIGLYDNTKWEDLLDKERAIFKLKEKWKGREIYEGDILSRDRKTIFAPHAEPQIVLVYYDIDKARFWVRGVNIDLIFFNMDELKEFKVIGNKFENFKLLEQYKIDLIKRRK